MKNILWMPVDLPMFEYGKEVIEDFKQAKTFMPLGSIFEAQRLTTKTSENYGIETWLPDLTDSQRKLADYIDQYLPFDHLINVKIHHPTKTRPADHFHYDFAFPEKNPELYQHNQDMEPCGYRLILQGNRTGDLRIIKNDQSVVPILPPNTDWYVLGHTSTPHSNIGYPADRYIVFCHAWINKQRHTELIERSLAKYKNYTVFA
jgi:hypothetical protein